MIMCLNEIRKVGLARCVPRVIQSLVGAKPKEHLLDGYSSVLDNLLRNGVSNSTVCLGRLQAIGFSGRIAAGVSSLAAGYLRPHRGVPG